MKKFLLLTGFVLLVCTSITGCGMIGSKTASMSIVYGGAAVFSMLILLSYCYFIQQKDIWFLLLFASVFIVNMGYFSLSISKTLGEALLANRISYFVSVFLPITMLMILFRITKLTYRKWFPSILLTIGFIVFLIAASPGYSTLYYKEVSLEIDHNVTTLNKVYGPLHTVYLFYLVIHFALMIGVSIYAVVNKKMDSIIQSVFLILAVFVNLGVWFFEQLVKIDFEILSVSYIISELFLFALHSIMLENNNLKKTAVSQYELPQTSVPTPETSDSQTSNSVSNVTDDFAKQYFSGLNDLTPTEKTIFNYYLDGKSTKEIMSELNITENTLKFHNKNIYGKFGVSSRKQLIQNHNQIVTCKKDTAL